MQVDHDGHSILFVRPIDQVDNHFNNGLFLFRFAFGDQQSQGNQGIVGQAFAAVFAVKDAIGAQEVDENSGSDSFVAIAEGVVLNDKVKQVSSFLFGTGVW